MAEGSAERYEIRIPVKDSDIDINGHVNNTVYLHWVQDAAVAHWRAAASPGQQAKIVWVVTRHEIDYKLALRKGDEVIARTWVGKASELIFERYTEILRASDMKLSASAKTLWCPINKATGKIMRVDQEVRNRFSVP